MLGPPTFLYFARVSPPVHGVPYTRVVTVQNPDGDQDLDVILGLEKVWYENLGGGVFADGYAERFLPAYQETMPFAGEPGGIPASHDFDGDGDQDLVMRFDDAILYFKNVPPPRATFGELYRPDRASPTRGR